MQQIRYLGTLLACLMLFTNTGSGAELTKRELTIENRAEVDAHCAYAYLMDDEDVRNTEVLPGFHVKGWIYVPSGHAVTIEYTSNYGFVYVCLITADGNQAHNPVSPLSFSVPKDLREDSFHVIHEMKGRTIGAVRHTSVNEKDLETKVFSRKNYGVKGWQLTTGIPGFVDIVAEVPSDSERFDGIYDRQEFVRHGKDYALLFATNAYQDPYWQDLGTPISDAEAIAVELFLEYGFSVDLQRNVTIRDISKALAEYAEKSYQPGDQLLVYFTGHGVFHEALKEGYIAGTDSVSPDTPGYQHSYLSHSELKSNLDKLGCERVLLVLDVDYGGTFDDTIALSKDRSIRETSLTTENATARRSKRRLDLVKTLKAKTRWYLSSVGKEKAVGKEKGQNDHSEHSPFASSFLTLLGNGGGKDSVLTVPEIEQQLPSTLHAELDKTEAAWREKYPLWDVKIQQTPASGPFGSGQKSDKAFVFIKSQK